MSSHRRRALTIALLAIAIAAPAQAAFPGKNGKLLFRSVDDLRISDTDPETVDGTVLVANAFDGRWSPDGTRIVFTVPGTDDVKPQVGIANADGTGRRVLTTVADQESARPAWSPDGTRIVFDRYTPDYKRERLMIMNSDGSNVRGLTPFVDDDVYDYSAVWSPDGRTIAFTSDDGSGDSNISLINPDGTNRRLFAASDGGEDYAAWSPDSRRIAYRVKGDVWVKPLAGGDAVLVAEGADQPEWSPDGVWIIYLATRELPGPINQQGYYARRADGTGDEVLISTELGGQVSWQPLCNLKGNSKANTLTGTAKAELICGFGGNDTIDGKGGNDIVFAGGGNDTVKGGGGRDVLVGQQGNDTLNGGPGKDRCVQGPGTGTLTSC